MNIKSLITLLFVFSAVFTQAQKNKEPKEPKFKTTPTGLKYIMYTDNKGEKAKIEDIIKFNFILKTQQDSVLLSSYRSLVPPQTKCQKPSYKGDLFEAFSMMAKGDSALFQVSADSFYKGQTLPVKSGSTLLIMIKMLDITSPAAFAEQMKAQREAQAKKAEENKNQEAGLLDKYIKEKAPNAVKTSSGLYYIIIAEGTGAKPQVGQKVVAHYTGTLLSGKEFDSDRGATFSFTLGQHQVIEGWDEGFALLKKGTKAKLIMPSSLAYGAQGAGGDIPPYSPLVFEVELVDIQ